jgi:CHASE2 domain-containing sensor protein
MATESRQPRALAMLAVATAVVVLSLLARSAGVLSRVEQDSVDTRFALRGDHGERDVAVVALDTTSYFKLPRPPLPRSMDATVIRNLHRAGARVIALDLSLERPGPSVSGDKAVIRALVEAQPAVVSVTAVEPNGMTDTLAGRVPFSHTPGVVPGTTFLEPDSDGSIRGYPQGFHGVQSLPTLAAGLLRGRHIKPAQPALIDYGGPTGTVTTIPLIDVLSNNFSPAGVRGRVVVIGSSAPVLQDLHQTPASGGGVMPGPEIMADSVQTALDGFPLRDAPPTLDVALIVLLGVSVPLAGLTLGPRRLDGLRIVLTGVGAAIAWSLAAQLAFNGGTVLDYTGGVLALLLGTVSTWIVATSIERREQQHLRARFAEYDNALVEAVLDPQIDTPLEPDRVIAGFRLLDQIGVGGMGVVYKATQIDLERNVALKLILQEHSRESEYRERFKRESLYAAAISHQNIVPVFQAGEDASLLYLAMQLVDELNLEQWLQELGTFSPTQAAHLVLQLGAALDAAHTSERRLVHRDVKPANVLITTDGMQHAFLTDFGLAIDSQTQSRLSERGLGTVDYMAPEQINGDPVTPLADVYALAGLLFFVLTGSVPFERDDIRGTLWAHLNAERPSVLALRPELPAEVDQVIARGMAITPAERHASAGAFARAAALALGVTQPTLE